MNAFAGRRHASTAACAVALLVLGCDEIDYVAIYLGEPSLPAEDFAWCACADLLATAPVTLRSDDAEVPAALAVRNGIHLEAPFVIDGSLIVTGGDLSATADATLEVGDELWVEADLSGELSVDVVSDAYVAGNVEVRALRVGGVLTLPETSTLAASEALEYAALRRTEVAIEPPCACGAEDLTPAAARLEAGAAATNVTVLDDATYGGFSGTATLALDCGLHRVGAISGDGDLVIDVQGAAALHVEGALNVEGALDVRLAPGASLELVVGGAVRAAGLATLGAPSAPERIELVSDGGQISFEAGGTLHGSVVAPASELLVGGPFELRGSLQTRRIVTHDEFDATFVEPRVPAPRCD